MTKPDPLSHHDGGAARPALSAEVRAHGQARRFSIAGPDREGRLVRREHVVGAASHQNYLDLHAALAADFGARLPLNRRAARPGPEPASGRLRPLLTYPLSPRILYGYGDPSVLRLQAAAGSPAAGYYAVVTSNDAPDAFPILHSERLDQWALSGFVFPEGHTPHWALTGLGVADFWAPELHRFPEGFRLCFCARERRTAHFAIGLARSSRPDGPFVADDEPLLTGNVIDPHLLQCADQEAYLLWKEDRNDVWPHRLAALLHGQPAWIEALFSSDEDRQTARLAAALFPWADACAPMERFFTLQPLIEAVTSDWAAFRLRLRHGKDAEPQPATATALGAILEAMDTPIHGQRLSPDGRSLVGERRVVLQNDQDWEVHLVEGAWVAEHAGRYYLFYAGNDFSTAEYGIGVAVADAPLGPYRKMAQPLLQSTSQWVAPGHPSVATGPDGLPMLFLHAYFPGAAGYKQFRALLAAPIAFDHAGVRLR